MSAVILAILAVGIMLWGYKKEEEHHRRVREERRRNGVVL